jgi:DGQHR domain-containing protein
MVSVFVGSDIADQAYIFSTVNLEQNKVNRSLTYDLFELARTRSPYKTCHNIAVALDRSEGGPFFHRIKRLGVTTEGRAGEMLTQATFVNSLVVYISDDPKEDRDVLLTGKTLSKVRGDAEKRLFLRNLFIDEDDVKVGKIIEEYFRAVRQRWPDAWDTQAPGYILNRTNGFRALMRLLPQLYNFLAKPGDLEQIWVALNRESRFWRVGR